MPYILKTDRTQFQQAIEAIKKANIDTVLMRKIFQTLAVSKLGLPVKNNNLLSSREQHQLIYSLSSISMNEGDLNYFFTEVMVNYIDKNGKKYWVLNRLEGMLDKIKSEVLTGWVQDEKNPVADEESQQNFRGLMGCCSKELYRVITGPYEDEKIADPNNGPVVKNLASLGQSEDY